MGRERPLPRCAVEDLSAKMLHRETGELSRWD
jgi:hypothetical protein